MVRTWIAPEEIINVPWEIGERDIGHGHFSYTVLLRDKPEAVVCEVSSASLVAYLITLHNKQLEDRIEEQMILPASCYTVTAILHAGRSDGEIELDFLNGHDFLLKHSDPSLMDKRCSIRNFLKGTHVEIYVMDESIACVKVSK